MTAYSVGEMTAKKSCTYFGSFENLVLLTVKGSVPSFQPADHGFSPLFFFFFKICQGGIGQRGDCVCIVY